MRYYYLNCLIDRVNVYMYAQINMNQDVYQIDAMIHEFLLNKQDDNHILEYEERRYRLE